MNKLGIRGYILSHFDKKKHRLNGRRISHLRKNKDSKVWNYVIFFGSREGYILLYLPMFQK